MEPDVEMEFEAAAVAANLEAIAREAEEEEQEVEEEEQQAMETSVPTPDHTYSTMVSSSQSTPAPIYSTATTTSVPSNNVPISDAMTDTRIFAMGMGHHPALLQRSPAQTTTSVQCPISSPFETPSPTFNAHLDVADMDFRQKKLGECKGRL